MAEPTLPQTHKRAPTVSEMREALRRTARNLMSEQARRVAVCWQVGVNLGVQRDAELLDTLEMLLVRMEPNWREHMDLIRRGPRRSWP